jgi:hypothetical protein
MQEVGGSIPPGSTKEISELCLDSRLHRKLRPHRLEAQDIALSRR